MRWTPEKIAQLRECAAKGMSQRSAAVALETSYSSVKNKAFIQKIHFHRSGGDGPSPHIDYAAAVERWQPVLGSMKDRLRADVERIMRGDQ
jgi:hypothetical protein